MKKVVFSVISVLVLLFFSCRNTPKVNLESEVEALRRVDKDWSDICETRDVDRFIEFYDSDAYLFDSDGEEYRGKDRLKEHISGVFSLPNNSLSWQIHDVYVAKSADIGYTSGTWNLNWTTETGDSLNGYGPYLYVWKKQLDGSWKNIVTSAINAKK